MAFFRLLLMGQRLSRKKKAEGGGEWTPTDHTAELHPPPDGEGGGKERKGEKSKKKRQKQRWAARQLTLCLAAL